MKIKAIITKLILVTLFLSTVGSEGLTKNIWLKVKVLEYIENGMHYEIRDESDNNLPDQWTDISVVEVTSDGKYQNQKIKIELITKKVYNELRKIGNTIEIYVNEDDIKKDEIDNQIYIQNIIEIKT